MVLLAHLQGWLLWGTPLCHPMLAQEAAPKGFSASPSNIHDPIGKAAGLV